MTNHQTEQKLTILWKDKKFLIGFILVLLSFILGFYGKILFIVKIYEPFYLITGLSIWAFSWILLFLGVFLVGWETVKIIQNRIHHHVKETYHYTKKFPKKSYHYTKELHRKGIDKLTKTSKIIVEKIRH